MKPNTVILGWPNSWRKKEEDSWRIFVDTIRNTAAAKMALLVPKGIQRCPDSGDKVKGKSYIYILNYLVPFLVRYRVYVFRQTQLFVMPLKNRTHSAELRELPILKINSCAISRKNSVKLHYK